VSSTADHGAGRVPLPVIAREWGRIGCIGFGGPPAHISLLRKLCVDNRGWLSAEEFEDGVAATNLLPGPASTQLSIFCAWRLAGPVGAVVGGACFIVPGLIAILALSALFLATHPPLWVDGAAAGAGAAVPAVALQAALGLAPASWRRATGRSAIPTVADPANADDPGRQGNADDPRSQRNAGWFGDRWPGALWRGASWFRGHWSEARWPGARWLAYVVIGGAAGALAGPYLVLVLAGCGVTELVVRTRPRPGTAGGGSGRVAAMLPLALVLPVATGGLLALVWVAFKVGALSYGGGFVIIPLMQHDVVHTYHWLTGTQFLSAVALGQVTPGPVVQTVAVVGYAVAGVGGGVLASFIAFLPSFIFVLVGAPRFGLLRANAGVQAFLTGAGPAAIGAIAGSTIPLAFDLAHLWQFAVLGLGIVWLLGLRRNVVIAIVGAAGLGVIAALAGAPIG
jgi:chromate transporter